MDNKRKWYAHDHYEALQHAGTVDFPRFVVRFDGKCYGFEEMDSPGEGVGGGMRQLLGHLCHKEGVPVTKYHEWLFEHADDPIEVYSPITNTMKIDKRLGELSCVHNLSNINIDRAMELARKRVRVKTLRGKPVEIVGVHGDSTNQRVLLFINDGNGPYSEWAHKLIRPPSMRKEEM